MPWPDTTFQNGGNNVHVMHALGEILQMAGADPSLTSDQKAIVARLVGLCMLRAYATSKTDAYLADQVKAAWLAAQGGNWPVVTQEINDNDLFAETL